MCCLFGLMDYQNTLTSRQRGDAVYALAAAAEERGTDAAGIAYRSKGRLRVYKRPLSGHYLPFRIPQDARVVMGHARMTTQGSAKKNFNNHPFQSRAGGKSFALVHNAVIYNDLALRRKEKLPRINIETDSYIAVLLLERGGPSPAVRRGTWRRSWRDPFPLPSWIIKTASVLSGATPH